MKKTIALIALMAGLLYGLKFYAVKSIEFSIADIQKQITEDKKALQNFRSELFEAQVEQTNELQKIKKFQLILVMPETRNAENNDIKRKIKESQNKALDLSKRIARYKRNVDQKKRSLARLTRQLNEEMAKKNPGSPLEKKIEAKLDQKENERPGESGPFPGAEIGGPYY